LLIVYQDLKKDSIHWDLKKVPIGITSTISNAFTAQELLKAFGSLQEEIDLQDAKSLCRLLFYSGFIISVERHFTFLEHNAHYTWQHPFLLPQYDWIPSDFDYARYLTRRNRVYSTKYGLVPEEITRLQSLHDTFVEKWSVLEVQVEKDIK
jgi:hypothetical protein